MVEKDRPEFLNLLMGTCEMLSSKKEPPSEFFIDMYWERMKRFSLKEVEQAFNVALDTLKFFPKPVEIIELITGGKDNLEDIAQIEATKVLQAIRRIGGGESVRFTDPITTAVLQRGFNGWVQLTAQLMAENEKWFIKDFISIYTAYARQNIKCTDYLPGIVEMENIKFTNLKPEIISVDKYFKQIEELKEKNLQMIKRRQLEHGV